MKSITGCINPDAFNFNSYANVDDGSCRCSLAGHHISHNEYCLLYTREDLENEFSDENIKKLDDSIIETYSEYMEFHSIGYRVSIAGHFKNGMQYNYMVFGGKIIRNNIEEVIEYTIKNYHPDDYKKEIGYSGTLPSQKIIYTKEDGRIK